MVLRITKEGLRDTYFGFAIAFWSITAAFFSFSISSYISIAIVFLFIVFEVLSGNLGNINNPKLFGAIVLMLIPYFTYAKLYDYTYWYSVLIYPAIILFVYFSQYSDSWEEKAIKLMYVGYAIYAAFTILMSFNSGLVNYVCDLFPESSATIMKQYSTSRLPGLTNHYSTNGMLISMGCLISGCELIKKVSTKNWAKFLFFVVALLLTGKRGHIIFMLGAVLFVYYLYQSGNKVSRFFKIIGVLLLITAAFYIVIQYIPTLSTFFTRFLEESANGDVSKGRYELWALGLARFKESPIFGIGWEEYMLSQVSDYETHNIYIQLLCETGVVGFAIYLVWFLYFMIKTSKLLAFVRKNNLEIEDKYEFELMLSVAIQVFFLVYGLTGNPLYTKIMYVPYFMSCAITLKINRIVSALEMR